jgi:hypothetical protein
MAPWPGCRSRHITLVTTLLDPVRYPADELIALYCRRWRIELCRRDLKTTFGSDLLTGRNYGCSLYTAKIIAESRLTLS